LKTSIFRRSSSSASRYSPQRRRSAAYRGDGGSGGSSISVSCARAGGSARLELDRSIDHLLLLLCTPWEWGEDRERGRREGNEGGNRGRGVAYEGGSSTKKDRREGNEGLTGGCGWIGTDGSKARDHVNIRRGFQFRSAGGWSCTATEKLTTGYRLIMQRDDTRPTQEREKRQCLVHMPRGRWAGPLWHGGRQALLLGWPVFCLL
jgi:hypothetical protein